MGQALLDEHGRFLVEEVAGRDRHGHCKALWDLCLSQFLTGFLQVGFIRPELFHIPTDIVRDTATQALGQSVGDHLQQRFIGHGPRQSATEMEIIERLLAPRHAEPPATRARVGSHFEARDLAQIRDVLGGNLHGEIDVPAFQNKAPRGRVSEDAVAEAVRLSRNHETLTRSGTSPMGHRAPPRRPRSLTI